MTWSNRNVAPEKYEMTISVYPFRVNPPDSYNFNFHVADYLHGVFNLDFKDNKAVWNVSDFETAKGSGSGPMQIIDQERILKVFKKIDNIEYEPETANEFKTISKNGILEFRLKK